MPKRTIMIVGRLVFALLSLAAVVAQLAVHIQGGNPLLNFFSYFTILSNIFAAIMLILAARALISNEQPSPRFELVRGAAVVAMTVVGIVFSILLSNEDVGSLMPWVNVVHHYLMPVVVVADWIYAPPRIALSRNQAAWWLIYPLVYLVYTLLRGAALGWYPYPFLNPALVGGYAGVAIYCVSMFLLFMLLGWLFAAIPGWRKPPVATQAPRPS